MEEWETLEEFPQYEVSTLGNVRNKHTEHILMPADNGTGTLMVALRKDGKTYMRAIHILVAKTFGNDLTDQGYSPIHIDRDRYNNTLENLEWRPRWYAMKRTRQDNKDKPTDPRRVIHVKSGRIFENALELARELGGFEDRVIAAAQDPYTRSYLGSELRFYYD